MVSKIGPGWMTGFRSNSCSCRFAVDPDNSHFLWTTTYWTFAFRKFTFSLLAFLNSFLVGISFWIPFKAVDRTGVLIFVLVGWAKYLWANLD